MRSAVRKHLGLKRNETLKIPPGHPLVKNWRIRARALQKAQEGLDTDRAISEAIQEIEQEWDRQSPFPAIDGLNPDELRERIRQIRSERRIRHS